jgi:hypothetical protein
VFRAGQLLLAGESNGVYQVWSVNTQTGARTLEIEMRICGESEGLDMMPTLNGNLHWLIAPFDPGCELTFGPTSALLHFLRAPAHRLFKLVVTNTQVGSIPGQVRATVRATFNGDPVNDLRVTFAGGTAFTNQNGVADVFTRLERPGRFKAYASRNDVYGLSSLVPVGMSQAASAERAALPPFGAG